MSIKTSLYSTAWNVIRYGFDYRGALDNWALYMDEIVIAVNTSDDGTFEAIDQYARERGYPVKLVPTAFSPDDPFMYGKIVNAALQACTGDLLFQNDLDERIRLDPEIIPRLHEYLIENGIKAYFIPTIDLYGDVERYVNVGAKWYCHLPGLFRGPVAFGLQDKGGVKVPDYNKTSTDELIDKDGNLVKTHRMWGGGPIEGLVDYVLSGLPMVYHLGYLNLKDRAERATWWKAFWERATAGDPNSHITSVEELMKRETKPHLLPLWESKS